MALADMLKAREFLDGTEPLPSSMERLSMVQGGRPPSRVQGNLPPSTMQGNLPPSGVQGNLPPSLPPSMVRGNLPGMLPEVPQMAPPQVNNMPVFIPEEPRKPATLNTYLKKIVPPLMETFAKNAISPEIIQEVENKRKEKKISTLLQRGIQDNPVIANLREQALNPEVAMEYGGLIGLAAGGEFSGRVPGKGHGMEDNVRMPIKENNKQVATLAVSPSEYVVDSHTMAALGNGNADRGADIMDTTVKQIREKAYGSDKQPREMNGLAALEPLIERV